MGCFYKEIKLTRKQRGIHLITKEISSHLKEIKEIKTGIATIFIKHTSASICISENADPTVRKDLNYFLNKIVPENDPNYSHTFEGPDDMPAHIKAVLTGSSVQVPIKNGTFSMGTWQGIYLCEHRNTSSERTIDIIINY